MAPAQFPAWLTAWAEEVFADIYSVLVAGPVAGVSIQAMLMGELPGVLLQDDADHPLPALRPEIAVAVLRKLASEGNTATGGWRRRRRCSSSGRPISSCARSGMPSRLPAAGSRCRWQRHAHSWKRMSATGWTAFWRRWCATPRPARWSSAETAAELYDQFAKTCAGMAGTRAPELEAVGDKVAVTPQVAGVHGGQRVVGEIGDPYLDELRNHALAGKRTLTVAEWQAVFVAGDWVTEEGGSGINPIR